MGEGTEQQCQQGRPDSLSSLCLSLARAQTSHNKRFLFLSRAGANSDQLVRACEAKKEGNEIEGGQETVWSEKRRVLLIFDGFHFEPGRTLAIMDGNKIATSEGNPSRVGTQQDRRVSQPGRKTGKKRKGGHMENGAWRVSGD